jgi:intermembrane space import and assembly protein 40
MSGMAEAIAEATKQAEGAADPEAAVKAALDCPCVSGLKGSSCGDDFAAALGCFMRAPEAERGSACVEPFIALHHCMIKHPTEFEEFTRAGPSFH